MIKFILAASVAFFCSSATWAQLFDYKEARAQAQDNEARSPAPYLEELVVFYKQLAITHMPACAEEVGSNDGSTISVVARLNPDGSVNQTWTLGASKLLPCFRTAMENASFPAPPFQPYYTVLDMHGAPDKFDENTQAAPATLPPGS